MRDLHKSHPGKYLTDVRTSAAQLWENNPYITPLEESDEEVEVVKCKYPLLHQSNEGQYHLIHGYPHHQYLHTNGCLPCCDNGGCWKSRVIPLGDGDKKDTPANLCVKPVRTENNIVVPKCIDMIAAVDIVRAVEKYLEWDNNGQ